MAKGFTWNTGRMGYGKHLNPESNGGGISGKRIRGECCPPEDSVLKCFKRLIAAKRYDDAFDLIQSAIFNDDPVKNQKRRDQICKAKIPVLMDC